MTVKEMKEFLETHPDDTRISDQESGDDIEIELGADDDNVPVLEIVLVN